MDSTPKSDYWPMVGYLFDQAKRWFGVAFCLRILAIVFGAMASVYRWPFEWIVWVLLGSTLISESANRWADSRKGLGEALLRKDEFRETLGWQIPAHEIRDARRHVPEGVRRRRDLDEGMKARFATKQPVGPRRALEALEESAWWSREQCGALWQITAAGCAFIALIAFAVALGGNLVPAPTGQLVVGRFAYTSLLLVFSGGFVALAISYFNFWRNADETQRRARELLGSPRELNEQDSVKLWNDYHIVRSGAPLLPGWYYKWQQDRLNEEWSAYLAEVAPQRMGAASSAGLPVTDTAIHPEP